MNQDYFKKAVAYFKYLHQNPEISYHEYETTKFIAQELLKLNITLIDYPSPTGLMATINPGCALVIAFRADIDALALNEMSNVAYQSLNEGVMHACGHDFHTANLLALAHYLKDLKLNITIKLIFQHAEEVTPGGSNDFINQGLVDDVAH
ncbi:MAG: M20/M25/M40 family metallo-hydrolase, partial [Bacilli bacterium]